MRAMLYLALVVAGNTGCGEALPRNSLVTNPTDASPAIRDACRVTEQKCTRCHTIGRVLASDASTRQDWEPVVTRMRQMASSGITKDDVTVVLRCLEQRK